MFTGLIEDVGRVAALESRESGARLGVRTRLTAELGPGDSVAVNGVCLTAVEGPAGCAWFDLSPQTLAVTALGSLVPGAAVNLERALKADARLGGHFVLGHVDRVACLTAMVQDGDFERLSIELKSPSCAIAVKHATP